MSQDLSRFPPNSCFGGTNINLNEAHMCYSPMHLDLSAPKESVADWVGTGKSMRAGQNISRVNFEDGTSTLMCLPCGVNAMYSIVGDREFEKGERVVGTVTREEMETAGIYEDHRNTFKEAVSVQTGGVGPDGELYSWTIDNHVFKFNRDAVLVKESSV